MREDLTAVPDDKYADPLLVELQTRDVRTHTYFTAYPEDWVFLRSAVQDALNRIGEQMTKRRR